METHVDNNVQEITTEVLPGIEQTDREETPDETPPIDNVTTAPGNAPAQSKGSPRKRKQRSFTMSDDIHAMLSAQADQNGANMSVYLETLVLMAEELAFDQETVDLLGGQATRTGMTKRNYLAMLILHADHVVTWDQQLHDTITTLAARAGLSRQDFLELLMSKADTFMTWTPPQPRPWWKFWARDNEDHQPVLPAVVEAESRPQLPG